MSSSFPERRTLSTLLLLVTAGLGACTEVQVEETRVELDTTACNVSTGNNNNGGSGPGGAQQPSTEAVMDTYIVQIFELVDPQAAQAGDCNDCLASRANCFFEKETCVCGDPTAVAPDKLPEMLKGVRLGVPANYGSLYCMRVMAVQRSSQSEHCECDPSWETPDKVRLCAVSTPYAASPLPIHMPVQCTSNRSFMACAADTSSTAAATATAAAAMSSN